MFARLQVVQQWNKKTTAIPYAYPMYNEQPHTIFSVGKVDQHYIEIIIRVQWNAVCTVDERVGKYK